MDHNTKTREDAEIPASDLALLMQTSPEVQALLVERGVLRGAILIDLSKQGSAPSDTDPAHT